MNDERVFDVGNEGEGNSATELAWKLLSGRGDGVADAEEAVEILEERVEAGDFDAMWMLGICKEFGKGTEQNLKMAENLYEQSSKGGSPIGSLLHSSTDYDRGSGKMVIRGSLNLRK